MKYFYCICLILLLCVPRKAFAQLEQGNFLVGGVAGFSLSSSTLNNNDAYTKKTFSYNLSPNISYFVTKGLALGAVLSYENTHNTYPSTSFSGDSKTSTNQLSVGPSVQYFYQIEDKLALQLQTSFVWGRQSGSEGVFIPNGFFDPNFPSDPNSGYTWIAFSNQSNTTTFSVGPGLTYFLSPRIGLQGNLLYQINRTETPEGIFGTNINKTSGLYFKAGLQIFLWK
jgi:hypothetical protein